MESILSQIQNCPSCLISYSNNDAYCNNCGYPLSGTENEQKEFLLTREIAQIDLDGYHQKIKSARNWFYYLAGLFTLVGVFVFFKNKDSEEVLALTIPQLILAIVFFILGNYSVKKPLACIVSGLSLYIIVQILGVIQDPISLAKGAFLKIIIIGVLIKGIKSAIEIEKIKKEHPSI